MSFDDAQCAMIVKQAFGQKLPCALNLKWYKV